MISLSSSDTTKRIAVGLYVANSTRYPYIAVHLNGFYVMRLILFKIHVRNNMSYWIRN